MTLKQKNELKEKIAVMQAFLDGKEIQFNDGRQWYDAENVSWNWSTTLYRIKPEKQYRAYTPQELAQYLDCEVVRKDSNTRFRITNISTQWITLTPLKCSPSLYSVSYEALKDRYLFADNKEPVGMEEKE